VPKNAQKRAFANPPPPAPYEQGETFAVVGRLNFRQKSKRITIFPFRFTIWFTKRFRDSGKMVYGGEKIAKF
jgi:hypothetical protein